MPLTAQQIDDLLNPPGDRGAIKRSLKDFDPSALFLLEFQYPNLFEPARADQVDKWVYRCKGCRKLVTRVERKEHFEDHKREQNA